MPDNTSSFKDKTIHILKKVSKIAGWILLVYLILMILLIVVIQIPAVQNFAKNKVVTMLTEKLKTKVEIGNIRLRLNGSLKINHIFIADDLKDTLLVSKSLAVRVNPVPLFHKRVIFSSITLEGTKLNYTIRDSLGASNIDFITKAFSDTTKEDKPEEKSSSPWLISFRNINLENVGFNMNNLADSSKMRLMVGKFNLRFEETDLTQMKFIAKSISLDDAQVNLVTYQKSIETEKEKEKPASTENKPIQLVTAASEIKLSNIKFTQADSATGSKSSYFIHKAVIKPETIDLSKRILTITKVELQKGTLYMNSGKSTESSPSEKDTSEQAWTISLKEGVIELDSIHVVNKNIHPDSALGYLSEIVISDMLLNLKDIHYSSVSWKGNIQKFRFKDLRTAKEYSLIAQADFKNQLITIQQLDFRMGSSRVFCKGELSLADTGKNRIPDFRMNVPIVHIYQADILPYLPKSNALNQYHLPANISFSGNFSSKKQHVKANGKLETGLGNIAFDANVSQPTSNEYSQYQVNTSIVDFNIGKLLNDTSLDRVTASIQVDGTGYNPETLSADIDATINSVFFIKHTYKDIRIKGSISRGRIDATTKITDKIANLALHLKGKISNNQPDVQAIANINNLDLKAMGFMQDTLAISGYLNAFYKNKGPQNFEGYTDSCQFTLLTPRGKIVTRNKLSYSAHNDSVKAFVGTNFGTLTYNGNIGIDKMPSLLNHYFSRYYSLHSDTLMNTRNSSFSLKLALNDLSSLRNLIPVNLAIPDGGLITAELKDNKLVADINFKRFIFNTLETDTLKMHAEGADSAFNIVLTASTFQNPARTIRDIEIKNSLDNGVFLSRIKFSDIKSEPWFDFGISAQKEGQTYRASLKEPLLMNYISWETDPSNEVLISEQMIKLQNLYVIHNQKKISLENIPNTNDGLRLNFQNLNLGAISQVVKGDSTSITGNFEGVVSLFNLRAENKMFDARIDVKHLQSGEYVLGNLSLGASNTDNPNQLDVRVNLAGQSMNLNAEGYYGLGENSPSRLMITANNMDLKGFSTLLAPNIEDPSGKINASILFTGTPNQPILEGNIRFDEINFWANAVQAEFSIDKQEIQFRGNRIRFPSFRINDEEDNPLIIKGDIVFENLKNPKYQINVSSDKFLAYHVYFNKQLEKESKIILTSDINIVGDIRSPVVKADIKLDEGSKVYYELANHGGDYSEDGVIEFVGVNNEEDEDTNQPSMMQNLDVTANITLPDATPITIMTDPAKGDILTVTADGRLTLNQRPFQSPKLVGKMDIDGGSYTMTLGGFKKKFDLQSNSTITWTGDIASPEFKLLAYYEIRTSPSPLFPEEIQGGVSQLPNVLPFRVNLTLTGTLASPSINFDIALPEEYRNSYAEVNTKLQQINSDPTQANVQSMSLVLFGAFDITRYANLNNLPSLSSLTDLSSFSSLSNAGGTNVLISRTLNQFAAQQIKFATLHFNLQSFDNLGGTTTQESRTELDVTASRKFIDNRLDAKLGGNIILQGDEQEQDKEWYDKVTPTFNIQYVLNKPRTLSIKAFREEEYRGILEGKVGNLGIGVMLQKDFNSLKDLFKKPPKNQERTDNFAEESSSK